MIVAAKIFFFFKVLAIVDFKSNLMGENLVKNLAITKPAIAVPRSHQENELPKSKGGKGI